MLCRIWKNIKVCYFFFKIFFHKKKYIVLKLRFYWYSFHNKKNNSILIYIYILLIIFILNFKMREIKILIFKKKTGNNNIKKLINCVIINFK